MTLNRVEMVARVSRLGLPASVASVPQDTWGWTVVKLNSVLVGMVELAPIQVSQACPYLHVHVVWKSTVNKLGGMTTNT